MTNLMDVCRADCLFGVSTKFRIVVSAVLLFFLMLIPAHAGHERYDYDSLGRLVRVIDERGQVTEYRYDGVGNILQVIGGGAGALAPSIASVTPSTIRRGETKQVVIAGSNFTGVAVSTPAIGLDILDVKSTADQITLRLIASATAELGSQSILLSSAAGSASATITVSLVVPKLYVDPIPLAVPPDNVARQIVLRLSNPDVIDHTIALAAGNGNIQVAPSQVVIVTGQMTASASVTGKTAGQSTLNLTSATLGNTSIPVYVTGEFAGIGTSHGRPLGVVLTEGPAAGRSVSPILSRALSVAVGNFISNMAPKAFAIGTGPTMLTVDGSGLNAAVSVTIIPAAGVTVGTLTPAVDGRSLTVPLTISSDASLETRQIIVKDATGNAFPVTNPQADRIDIVRPSPEIDSIEPLYALRGSVVTMTIRGRNLQGMQAEILPATGMTMAANPAVNADGTVATVQFGVGVDAAVGEYLVVARTPGGASSTTKSGSNTFKVANEFVSTVTPISASPVGVILQDGSAAGNSIGVHARHLGIAIGSVVNAVSPTSGMIGNTISLTLQGSELGEITSIEFLPSTGLTVGSILPATNGKSADAQLTIAADAPLEVRRMVVKAGATEIPFASAAGDRFLVTAPMPEILSISPIVMQIGQTAQTLTIRGRNLGGASAVVVTPFDGITVSTPTVGVDGTELTVNISIAANAAAGQRIVSVVALAGQSDSVPTASNTLTIANNVQATYAAMTSPVLGILFDAGLAAQTSMPVFSNALGVVMHDGTSVNTQLAVSNPVGVTVGSVATGLEPSGFAPGESSTLLIRGIGLDQVTAITATPAEGITLGAPILSAGGNSLLVTLTAASDAQALIQRRVQLFSRSEEVLFIGGISPQIVVGPGIPIIDSITPILANQDDTVSMVVRGAKLNGATAVTITPPEGITVSNALAVNADGTEIAVNLAISPDAPIGARVVQVWVPGAATTDQAIPANTFTINPR